MKSYIKKLQRFWPLLAIFAAVYTIMVVQLQNKYTIFGADTWFHYSRFNEAAQQIKHGTFSYFQMNYSFDASGRIINAMYGPIFVYLMGLLLLLAGSWYHFQLLTYIFIGVFGGGSMYYFLRQLKVRPVISVLFAIFYMYIGPIQSWVGHTNFTAWGGAIAPLILLEGVNMITNKAKPVRWVRLAVLISIIAQIHILSTVILATTLTPFILIGFYRTDRKLLFIRSLAFSIGLTLVLTFNIWLALFLQFHNNTLASMSSFDLSKNTLELSPVGTVRRYVLPVMKCFFEIEAVFLIVGLIRNQPKLPLFLMGYGLVLVFVCSSHFPWVAVQTKLPALRTFFQFPYRIEISMYPLCLAGFAMMIEEIEYKPLTNLLLGWTAACLIVNYGADYHSYEKQTVNNYEKITTTSNKPAKLTFSSKHTIPGKKKLTKVTAYVRVASKGSYSNTTTHVGRFEWEMQQRNYRYKLFTELNKIYPDYLPAYKNNLNSKQARMLVQTEVHRTKLTGNYHTYPQKDGSLKIVWNSKQSGTTRLPVIIYHNSRLTINDSQLSRSNMHLSVIGVPKVKSKSGQNVAFLKFIVPIWFTVLSWLGAAGWLTIAAVYLKRHWASWQKVLMGMNQEVSS